MAKPSQQGSSRERNNLGINFAFTTEYRLIKSLVLFFSHGSESLTEFFGGMGRAVPTYEWPDDFLRSTRRLGFVDGHFLPEIPKIAEEERTWRPNR